VAPIPAKAAGGSASSSAAAMPSMSLGADEAKIMACFAGGAILAPDALVAASGLPSHSLSATLMMLELKRLVAKRADGSFEAR
jgi:DNA processing protein